MLDQTMAWPATEHRYPRRTLVAAAVRAGAGFAAVAVLAVATGPSSVMSVLYVTLFTVFLAYAGRALLRGVSTVVSDDTGLTVLGPLGRSLAWIELTDVRLAYYTTRRDGENGWMELAVRGPGGTIRVDSDIEGFAVIARRSREAADARGVGLSSVTVRNFEALLDTPTPQPASSPSQRLRRQ